MSERTRSRRWARVRQENRHAYPVHYEGQWFRVAEGHHSDMPGAGHIWLAVGSGLQKVTASDFEIAQRNRRRIVVADDEASIRQTLQAALQRQGYEVYPARDGDEASRLWREIGPDLIITDIHMPGKSGLLLMQELQESSASSRVIAMTDGGPERNLRLLGVAELLGAVRNIPKPFTLEAIMAAVEEELSEEP